MQCTLQGSHPFPPLVTAGSSPLLTSAMVDGYPRNHHLESDRAAHGPACGAKGINRAVGSLRSSGGGHSNHAWEA